MQALTPKQDITFYNEAELITVDNDNNYLPFTNISPELHILKNGKVIINSKFQSCRQSFSSYFSSYFHNLKERVYNGRVSFSPAVKDKDKTIFANGGIRFSVYSQASYDAFVNFERTKRLMDIFVGNTCVLVDQKNSEAIRARRKISGMAGDCVKLDDNSGVYNVLSNFWLENYQLLSLALGLVRVATNVSAQTISGSSYADYFKAFTDLVPQADIEKAINDNDYDLALKNFNKIKDLLVEISGKDKTTEQFYPITSHKIKEFEDFISRPMDYWFKQKDGAAWVGHNYNVNPGIERFLLENVKSDMDDRKYKLKNMSFEEIWVK